MAASPRQVWDVLCDGPSYARWVVGTGEIRAVDRGWPEPGTCLHYTVGRWGLTKRDRTVSRQAEPLRHLELEAQAWPAGAVRIAIDLAPEGEGTHVRLDEYPVRGPLARLHNPLTDLLIKIRNERSLDLLRRLAEQRA